ncbi:MAG TPA: FAD-dependent oxidoreductase [Gemmatimonas sp.]|nr:FAD-dependent oxidoreductase [Gemmatimonas sp.]
MPRSRRLVLVGGGHAHVEVLRRAAEQPLGGEIVLVSPYPEQFYTGMLSAQLRGAVEERELSIDLRALCVEAGARFVEAAAIRVQASRDGVVVHTAGEPVTGDVCSLDIGSAAVGADVPGVAEFAYTVRPLARWRALVALVHEVMRAGDSAPFAVAVVGGGASGVELMLALVARGRAAGQSVTCTLVTASDDIVEDMGPRFGRRARALLRERGVTILTGRTVARVAVDHIELSDGTRVESALTLWATGSAAPPLLRDSGLPVDHDGYLRVDASLRCVTGDAVFGAGDCIALVESPWAAKAGVYAVRQAPVLTANLRAVLRSPPSEPRLYEAQQHILSILDTADGKGLLYWRGWSSHSKWAMRLKRYIDLRWLAQYRVPPR